jgi:hypothetical protein
MSMIFISIQIKFDIDINYNELLETICEHNKRKKKSIIVGSVQQCKAQV